METQKSKEKIIDEILERSIANVYPSKELLKEKLLSGKKLRIYVGADATGANLHVGHSTNYILLEKLRKLGHETIVLFGDFTAMIGDPSDKMATRVALTKKEVERNIKTWKKQIAPIISIGTFGNKAKIVKNSSWLSKLSFKDIVRLSSHFTVQQMIERDMFQKRLKEEKPIYLHEFLYPLMQGYDSVVLDVDIEIGGNDQTFNMLAGRILQKKIKNKEKFVITTTLLENPKTGKKLMSKSEGGYVALDDSPQQMFGKIMALPDEVMISVFTDCTFLSQTEIEEIKKDLISGKNPRDIKIKLAEEIVTIYHGKEKSKKAKESFVSSFSEKNISEDSFREIKIEKEELLSDVLVYNNVLGSKGEFARLVKEGGVTNLISGEKVADIRFVAKKGEKYKIGKKHFIKIV